MVAGTAAATGARRWLARGARSAATANHQALHVAVQRPEFRDRQIAGVVEDVHAPRDAVAIGEI